MTEKKDNIKNGQNISLEDGNIVVLNDVSVAEKVEVKEEAPLVEEQKVIETPAEEPKVEIEQNEIPVTADEFTPDKVIAPETTDVSPSIDIPNINLDDINFGISTPTIEPEIPVQETPAIIPDLSNLNTQEPAFIPEYSANDYNSWENNSEVNSNKESQNVITNNSFGDVYTEDEYEKVESTVVTKEDAKNAKEAYMKAAENIYDKGPGKQLNTLIEVAAEMDSKLDEIATKGYMNGKDYEDIKRIRNRYRGLQLKNENQFQSSYSELENDFNGVSHYDDYNNGGMGMAA